MQTPSYELMRGTSLAWAIYSLFPIEHAVTRLHFTSETGIHSHGSPYGICGCQSDSGTRFSLSTSNFYSTSAPYVPVIAAKVCDRPNKPALYHNSLQWVFISELEYDGIRTKEV